MTTKRSSSDRAEPVDSHRRLAAEIKRRRLEAGLTHGRLALETTYSREYVGRTERPEAGFPSADVVRAIDDALGAGGDLVALQAQAEADRLARRSSRDRTSARTASRPPLDRRQLITAASGTLAGVAISSILSERRQQVAPELVHYFTDQLRGHYSADMYLGPHMLVPTIETQYRLLMQLADAASSDLRRKFLEVAAAYAALAGWLYQDVGDMALSARWRAETLELAHRAADPQLVGYALVNRAMLTADLGNGVATVDLAESVLADERALAPKVRVLAAVQAAHGHSLMGDRDACARLLDRAARLVASVDDEYVWGNACRRTLRYVDVQRATCYGRLGMTDQALQSWSDVLVHTPASSRRDTGVYLARQATSLARADLPEQVVSVAVDAMRCYHDTGSARLRTELLSLKDLSTPWTHSSVGRELHGILAPLAVN